MCGPSDLKQRVDPSGFERFELGGAVLYVQRELLSEGVIEFSIPGEGTFSIAVKRRAG
jgi:hypothetical protein